VLGERGIQVSYETVRRRVAKFGTHYGEELRRRERQAGRTWHLEEMAARVGGTLRWLGRAVDEHGQTLDVLLQTHRDTAAAARFFQRHQPTRLRERAMRRFESATSAQRFPDAFARVSTLLRPGRHRPRADPYRATMRERVATWRLVAELRAA
jgi:putative transposase